MYIFKLLCNQVVQISILCFCLDYFTVNRMRTWVKEAVGNTKTKILWGEDIVTDQVKTRAN